MFQLHYYIIQAKYRLVCLGTNYTRLIHRRGPIVPYRCSLGLSRFEQDSDGCCSFIQEGL